MLNEPAAEAKVGHLVARCTELRSYIENNEGALIDYGERYRAGKPISTSRAESTVNQLVNARMNKRRQMRWSPRGAHRVLQVRAAVLDGRFGQHTIQLAAQRPRFLTLPIPISPISHNHRAEVLGVSPPPQPCSHAKREAAPEPQNKIGPMLPAVPLAAGRLSPGITSLAGREQRFNRSVFWPRFPAALVRQ